MITILAPLWLILLVLLPVVHWLHRFRQQSSVFTVTSPFLWRELAQSQGSGQIQRKPDPLWILRTIILALLILAISQIHLNLGGGATIEVWLDDSLSMFTQEPQGSRIKIGLDKLQDYLEHQQAVKITVHSLGNPALSLDLEPDNSSGWAQPLHNWSSEPKPEPSPPSIATLSLQSTHILVTDGADTGINDWAQAAPLHHIIRVGQASDNVALTQLSVRNSLNRSGDISGLVRIDNLAASRQEVSLTLKLDDHVIKDQKLQISASDRSIITFNLPSPKRGKIQANIENFNDALQQDNFLQVDLNQLNPEIHYILSGDCGPYFQAALDSLPALIQKQETAHMIIACSDQPVDSRLPVLRFHAPNSTQKTFQPAHWHITGELASLQLPPGLVYSREAPRLSLETIPLLSADGYSLILKYPQSEVAMESFIDMHNPEFARDPEYPLLIMGLIAEITGKKITADPLITSREIHASRIRAHSLPETLHAKPVIKPRQIAITPMLLVVCMALLLVDAAITFNLTPVIQKRRA